MRRARRSAGLRVGLLLLAAASLSGCGFRLEGSDQLPRSLASARVEAVDAQSDFCHGLRAALLASGARLDAEVPGAATIRILEDSTSERVLSVSGFNIPTAFELSYHVRVAVESQGKELMAPEEHTLTREYSFDQRTLLAKEREREVLTQALADDLVALLMRRFAAL